MTTEQQAPASGPQAADPGVGGFAHVELVADDLTGLHVVVNGTDVSRSVVGVEVIAARGDVPVVRLTQRAGTVELSGPGIVHLLPTDEGPAPQAEAVAEWLSAVDPIALEAAMLGGGQADSPGTAALRWLIAQASTSTKG